MQPFMTVEQSPAATKWLPTRTISALSVHQPYIPESTSAGTTAAGAGKEQNWAGSGEEQSREAAEGNGLSSDDAHWILSPFFEPPCPWTCTN